jgi:hypothetical protein
MTSVGRATRRTPRGFDRRVAAVGAGVVIGLVLIATSATLLVWRRRTVQVA